MCINEVAVTLANPALKIYKNAFNNVNVYIKC